MSVNDMQIKRISRRSVIKSALLGAALPVGGLMLSAQAAAPLVPLDEKDPQAKALGFAADSTKVDAKLNPTFKTGQHCASCVQFQGQATDARGGCNIFPGKSVGANSWCRVWTAKPAK